VMNPWLALAIGFAITIVIFAFSAGGRKAPIFFFFCFSLAGSSDRLNQSLCEKHHKTPVFVYKPSYPVVIIRYNK
jgi:hypothetical protein